MRDNFILSELLTEINILKDEDGSCFRAYRFVDNSKAYDTVDSAEVLAKAVRRLGRFQKCLSDFPAESLNEIIKFP